MLIALPVIGMAANRTGVIRTGYTMMPSPMTFSTSDSIIASATYTITITNAQKYLQHQTFTTTLATVSGAPSITITAYGKVTSGGSWVQIGTPVSWTSSSNNPAEITSAVPLNYNYLKLAYVANGTTQHAKVTSFEVKTANVFDIGVAAAYIKLDNDQIFSLGTTTTNAATKVTLEEDAATTGIGQLIMGTSTYPQVVASTAGANVFGITNAIEYNHGNHSVENLIGQYEKVVVTDDVGDPDMTVVGVAPRVYIGVTGGSGDAAVAEAYGIQNYVNHKGTGAITQLTAESTVLDLGSDNFTASQVNGLDVVVQGTSTVTTAKIKGISVDIKTGRTVESGLSLNMQSTSNQAVEITGSPVHDIKLQNDEYIDNTTNGSITVPNVIRLHTPAVVNASVTLSAANMLAGVVATTATSAVAFTTPTATAIAALIPGCAKGTAFDLIFDNSASSSSGAITITLDGSITVVNPAIITGGATLTLAVGTTGKFSFYFTSATTAKCYRVY